MQLHPWPLTIPTRFSFPFLPCLLLAAAGSNTPWGTRMGSEEYEPDARLYESATTLQQIGQSANPATFSYDGGNSLAMGRYFDLYYGNMTLDEFRGAVKPYMYGHVTEVKVCWGPAGR